jgi:hypothetical protein
VSTIRDGLRVPTTLFEAAVWHNLIKVRCPRCPNVAIFEAAGVWWHFQKRSGDLALRDARHRFYCLRCSRDRPTRVRATTIELVRGRATRELPLPDDREWKRALSRFRA